MPRLPRGTVTFLFSDVEGSTLLLRRLGQEQYGRALADYQRLVRESCVAVGGTEVDTQGDAFFFVFPRARDAVKSAAEAQRALTRHTWPDGASLHARIGLHTGEASVSGRRYVGLSVHRAARVSAAAAGGQVLLSQATAVVLEDEDLGELGLRDLGRHDLKDFEHPVRLYQLQAPDLPAKFPAAKTKRARARLATPWLVAGLVAFVVALGLLVAILARGDGGGVRELGPGSVGVIDPKTNRVVDAIPLGFSSPLIAAGEGYVWVVDWEHSTLTKIDPRTRNIVWTQAIEADATPTGIAVGKGSVWVGAIRGRTLELLELGPELGEPRRTVVVERGRTPFSVGREKVLPAIGGDTVFTLESARGQVSRVEADEAIPLTEGVDADAIAALKGTVWLAGKTQIAKISARTGKTLAPPIPVALAGSEAISIQATARAVWFAGSGQPWVSRSTSSGPLVTTFPVGDGPSAIALGEGAVWVASADGSVSRVNADNVVTIALAQPPAGIVAAYGLVWTSPGS